MASALLPLVMALALASGTQAQRDPQSLQKAGLKAWAAGECDKLPAELYITARECKVGGRAGACVWGSRADATQALDQGSSPAAPGRPALTPTPRPHARHTQTCVSAADDPSRGF